LVFQLLKGFLFLMRKNVFLRHMHKFLCGMFVTLLLNWDLILISCFFKYIFRFSYWLFCYFIGFIWYKISPLLTIHNSVRNSKMFIFLFLTWSMTFFMKYFSSYVVFIPDIQNLVTLWFIRNKYSSYCSFQTTVNIRLS
jgi:hypothetical protein